MKTLGFCLISLLWGIPSALACDCKPSEAIAVEVPKYTAIFIGEVVSRQSNFHEVKVQETFKGVKKDEILKVHYDPNHMCDMDLEVKGRYLFFMNQANVEDNVTPGMWRSSLCSPSRGMKFAGPTLKALRAYFKKEGRVLSRPRIGS